MVEIETNNDDASHQYRVAQQQMMCEIMVDNAPRGHSPGALMMSRGVGNNAGNTTHFIVPDFQDNATLPVINNTDLAETVEIATETYEIVMDNAHGHIPGDLMTSRDTTKARISFVIKWVIDVLSWLHKTWEDAQ